METKVTLNNLQSQVEKFTEKLNASLVELGILDRCKKLEVIGQVISAVNVNSREIIIFQLIQPISLGKWRI